MIFGATLPQTGYRRVYGKVVASHVAAPAASIRHPIRHDNFTQN
jgi:hypothetical protein